MRAACSCTLPKPSYREDDGLYLESDTDEQLLIHVPFNSACKLSGLVVKSTKSGDQVREAACAGGYCSGLAVKRMHAAAAAACPALSARLPMPAAAGSHLTCLHAGLSRACLLFHAVQAPKRIKLFVNQ